MDLLTQKYPNRQSNPTDFKIDTCRFLARHSPLLGWGKGWLAQCQDNVIEWDGYQIMALAAWVSKWGSTI